MPNKPADNRRTTPPKKDFLSEAPSFVKFFFSPRVPIAIRAGLGSVLVLIFLYPVIASRSGSNDSQKESPSASAPAKDEGRMVDQTPEVPSEPPVAPAAELNPPAGSPLFVPVPGVFPLPMRITQDPQGAVWIVSQRDVWEFKNADPNRGLKKLDPEIYDHIFNNDLPLLTAASMTPSGELWTGSKDGQILRYSNYDWKVVWESNEPIKTQVRGLAFFNNDLFVGAHGLWKWSSGSGKLTRYSAFQGVVVNDFVETPTHQLYMATQNGVWFLTEKGWQRFFAVGGLDQSALTIYPDAERGFLLGTHDGLVRISPAGVIMERALPTNRVKSISADREGNIWAGTAQQGLKFWDRENWFQLNEKTGLPGNDIDVLFVDTENRLWLGVRSKGVFTADSKQLAALVRKYPDDSKPIDTSKPKVYASACKAAAEELRGLKVSQGIAVETLDGEPTVFFDGARVCPSGKGYRRDDGVTVILRDWHVTIFSPGSRQDLDVPKDYPADQTSALFLDAKNRLWFGFATQGPLVYDNGTWTSFNEVEKLAKNPVQAISEDAEGNIWIGTSPPYDKETKSYLVPNLHRYDGQGWMHFSPHEGLGFWTTTSLRLLRSGKLAVGTSGGLSIVNKKEIRNFGEDFGLAKYYVHSLSQDVAGDIWISHLYFYPGVSWFDGTTFHSVDSSQGLFNDRISLISHDGLQRIWLLASNGTVGVYPRAFFDKKVAESSAAGNPKAETEDHGGPKGTPEAEFEAEE